MSIEEINGRYTCTKCGYEWSACLGDNEIPQHCACEGKKVWFINGPFNDKDDIFLRYEIDGESFDVANFSCNELGNTKDVAQMVVDALNKKELQLEKEI